MLNFLLKTLYLYFNNRLRKPVRTLLWWHIFILFVIIPQKGFHIKIKDIIISKITKNKDLTKRQHNTYFKYILKLVNCVHLISSSSSHFIFIILKYLYTDNILINGFKIKLDWRLPRQRKHKIYQWEYFRLLWQQCDDVYEWNGNLFVY